MDIALGHTERSGHTSPLPDSCHSKTAAPGRVPPELSPPGCPSHRSQEDRGDVVLQGSAAQIACSRTRYASFMRRISAA
jgi:hypothetical protein